MRRIVYSRSDGTVAVIIPVKSLDRAREVVPDDAVNVLECDKADLPSDPTFRDAWRMNGRGVEVDMPAAREIHRRRIDNAKLKILLGLQHRELLGEDVSADLMAVRCIDPSAEIAAARTPDELREIWPSDLPKP